MFLNQRRFTEDDKQYTSDALRGNGIQRSGGILQSKRKAHSLWESDSLDPANAGKTILLKQIHAFLFEGLYDFAGKIRTKTISKGGFVFVNGDFLPQTLNEIDAMPDSSFGEIVAKYIEMNIAHPFLEGNGRATRIWLDYLLKVRLGKCVDWSRIEKKDYLSAMVKSPVDPKPIHRLLQNALTEDIKNRELFLKGIDHSYYYEEEDDVRYGR